MTDDRRSTDRLAIRPAGPGDAIGIGDVWLSSWRATFEFPPSRPDADVRRWLAEELVPRHTSWVAVDTDGRVVGLMALSDAMVEQLYVAPDWIGRGLGRRFIAMAKELRPAGLDLYCFQANARARGFYEAHGFAPVTYGDGSGNQERQPDILYRWRPGDERADDPAIPDRTIRSADNTSVAVFRSGQPNGPPLVLVHGAAADHTTFRVVGPLLGRTFDVYAMDRRGRGASGDTASYAIEREFEDVAAVASAIAEVAGGPVAVFGHSYGGRCALGAALSTSSIGRVVSYEGAPTPPGQHYGDAALTDALRRLAAVGDDETLLATFLTRVVGLDADGLAAYRASPVWPLRVAAAPTIVRELAAESTHPGGLDRLGLVRQPVLQLLGGESRPAFGSATRALDERLADGRIVVIAGAKHAAHHSHPDAVVDAITSFLIEP